MRNQCDNGLIFPDQGSVIYEPPLDTEDTTPNNVVKSNVNDLSDDQLIEQGVGRIHVFLWAATIGVMIITD